MKSFFEHSKVHWDSNSQNGGPLGNVWVHSLTPSYTPNNMKCDSWASLLACTFASPCLNRELNLRVATLTLSFIRIHEVDDHDQWTRHINEIAMKNPPKLLEGNHCVSYSQTKKNTIRKNILIMLQLSFTKHQTITFIMEWQCLT